MSPINHGAFALVIKRKYPDVPLWALLIGVQLFEFLWIILNFAGLERTATEQTVAAIDDIHFVHMPLSHSIGSTVVLCLAVWLLFCKLLAKPVLGIALTIAIASHIVLDILVHVPDIVVVPFTAGVRLGTGLYGIPIAAFVFELAFAIGMWAHYRGSRKLFWSIVVVNLLAVTMYVPWIAGPERWFSNSPISFVVAILIASVISTGVLLWASDSDQAENPRAG